MRPGFFYAAIVLLYCHLHSTAAQSQLKKIYLNPKSVSRERQAKYVDSIRFIPLELKDDVKLGAYYNIQVTEKYLMLNDYMNSRFVLYLKDGRFVKDISYKKLGGNFYPSYQERTNKIIFFGNNKNYTLTPKDQVKIKLEWDNPRNKRYFKKYAIDLNDTSFVISKEIPNEKDITRVSPYYSDYFIQGQITTSALFKDSVDYELKIYKNNKLVNELFAYNRITEPKFLFTEESIAFTKTDTAYINLVTRPYCDTIYKLVKDSLFAAYQLVLPLENSLPASFFKKPFKNKTERDNFFRNNGWMLRQVYSFYETPGFIFFMIRYLSNFDSYIYEKQTNTTYKTKNIKADSSEYNLQLMGDLSLQKKGDRFYKPQSAGDLLAFFDKNKNIPVPKELEDFIKSKPPGTAPVIVEFKLKN